MLPTAALQYLFFDMLDYLFSIRVLMRPTFFLLSPPLFAACSPTGITRGDKEPQSAAGGVRGHVFKGHAP